VKAGTAGTSTGAVVGGTGSDSMTAPHAGADVLPGETLVSCTMSVLSVTLTE
jgi:hypothetical protein